MTIRSSSHYETLQAWVLPSPLRLPFFWRCERSCRAFGLRKGEMPVSKVTGENRHDHADDMSDGFPMPCESHRGKNEACQSDAHDPYLCDRQKVHQREPCVFRGHAPTACLENEVLVEQIGCRHATELGDDDRRLIRHHPVECEAA